MPSDNTFEQDLMEQTQDVFSGEVNSRWKFSTSLKTDLAKALYAFFRALVLQADRKQQDYGSSNLTRFGPEGILVRLCDKVSRLENLIKGKRKPAVSESVLDTWADGIVYQGIGYLMQAGLWPLSVEKHIGPGPRHELLGEVVHTAKTSTERPPPHQYKIGDKRIEAATSVLSRTVPISPDVAHDFPIAQHRLVLQSLAVCLDAARPEDVSIIPKIGATYKHRGRAPGKIRVEIVLPNYNTMHTEICVVFSEVHPGAGQSVPLQVPDHLRVEPLLWFDEHYVMEDQ